MRNRKHRNWTAARIGATLLLLAFLLALAGCGQPSAGNTGTDSQQEDAATETGQTDAAVTPTEDAAEENGPVKVLVVETNVDHFGSSDRETGLWLEEAASFYDVLTKAGFEVDFASINGGPVPVDPASAEADDEIMRIYNDSEFHRAALEETKRLSDLSADDYAAVYFAGGHGVMWDFPGNEDIKNIAESIYAAGGYITSVCHGEVALLDLTDPSGEYLVKGKKINGFTDEEEELNGTADEVPFAAETEMIKRGADFVKGEPFTEFAVEDQRFITGQNPMSSAKVGELLVAALQK